MNIQHIDEKLNNTNSHFEQWSCIELILFEQILNKSHSSQNLNSTLSTSDVRKILDIKLISESNDEELIYRLERLNIFLMIFDLVNEKIFIYKKCSLSKGFFIQFQKIRNWKKLNEVIKIKINQELLIASTRKSILLTDAQLQVAEYYFSYKSFFIDNIFKYKNIIYEQVQEGISVQEAFNKFKVR